ncbi:MAG: carbohydrate ABC transporter permease, partial [Calditrichaeota bacterium]
MARRGMTYLILLAGAVVFVYPFLWMLLASLAPEPDIARLVLLPSRITVENYRLMMAKIPILRALLNSLLVAGSVTAGVLVFGSMVGYALSRLQFRGRELIFYIILFTMTLPFQITLIPQYILMVKFRWVDTYLALIVPYLLNGFAIVMFRQYFKSIPQDLIDAARLDGCGELQILFRILWPISRPALVTVGIVTFMGSWNEVLWPIIVMRTEKLMTMPQLVALFVVG